LPRIDRHSGAPKQHVAPNDLGRPNVYTCQAGSKLTLLMAFFGSPKMEKRIKRLTFSTLAALAIAGAATNALAKKSGSEVRNEPPPAGKGSGIDDRQAKPDARGPGDPRERGQSAGSYGRESAEGSTIPRAGRRIVISDEDRL
jgi:hypothetical protein